MSKNYKINRKKNIEEEKVKDENTLSKKELYDLKKQEKIAELAKKSKKTKNKNKKSKKTYQTNLLGRIFAIVMLILMIGSVIATISYSFR